MSSHPQIPAVSGTRPPELRWIRAVSAIPLLLALAASVTLLFLPVYTTDSAPGGAGSATLIGHNGPWVLIHLTVPVLLTAAIAVARGRARLVVTLVCTVLLVAFTVLSLPSIGMFYLPAALVGLVAAVIRVTVRRRAFARDPRR